MNVLADVYAHHSRLIDQIGINALLALSLSVSLQAGQLALAQAGLAGIAAYVSAIASMQYHVPLAGSSGWRFTALCAVPDHANALKGPADIPYPACCAPLVAKASEDVKPDGSISTALSAVPDHTTAWFLFGPERLA